MSQIGNNQVIPGNTALATPQRNSQSGSIQGGNPPPATSKAQPRRGSKPLISRIPGLDDLAQFDDQSEKENPCRFCCDISTSVRIIVAINLGYLFLKFFIFLPSATLYELLSRFLLNFVSGNGGWPYLPCYMLAHPLFIFGDGPHFLLDFIKGQIWLLDVVTTSLFLRAVYFPPEGRLEQTIFLSNVFMWYNLCYPGIVIYPGTYITILDGYVLCKPQSRSLPFWFLAYALMVTWVVFNGLVAKSYRNGLNRARILMAEQEQGDEGVMSSPSGVNAEGADGGPKLEQSPA